MLEKLGQLLREHHEKAHITCDETCFCWDIEAFLAEQERDAELHVQPSAEQDGAIIESAEEFCDGHDDPRYGGF